MKHAGYDRDIVARNPQRYNGYGDELEDSDSDPEADVDAEEENPYGDIRLEGMLVLFPIRLQAMRIRSSC